MTTPPPGDTTRLPDGRLALRIERHLSHPPEKVWRALTTPEHLSAWYPFPAVELDLRTGGVIRFDNGEGGTLDGEITDVDPPKVFAFREVDDHLRLELHDQPPGCLLVLTHTFAETAGYENYTTGWHNCLDALATHLSP
ncbi:SRPBCC family protein [Crossiella sp. SN42]|uniref:SRPBCC family protein n=1 Tax=Crossiella sp. SN42 TaxID=2944808 RepID=UPI00207C4355|nr:SRPBCC family protein [Crossiella sp. SN42]MCO1576123.1 SRPBCC family protein [Crossiella sp. SN42]